MAKPTSKALGKRRARPVPPIKGSKTPKTSKGARGDDDTHSKKPKRRTNQPKKIKLRDQKVIPVPRTEFADSGEGSHDELLDLDLGEDDGLDAMAGAETFLAGVDRNALSRSAKETRRLHELSKSRNGFPKQSKEKVRLPTPDSAALISDFDMDSEVELDSDLSPNDDQDALNEDDVAEGSATSSSNDDDDNSEINAAFDDDGVSSDEDEVLPQPRKRRKVDGEAEYEVSGRGRWAPPSPKPEDDSVEVGRLPIKLQNGQVQRVEGMTRLPLPPSKRKPLVAEVEGEVEGDKLEEEQEESDDGAQAERMAGQKGRFGRLGVAEIVSSKGWKSRQRLEAAKEQIAAVGAEILAGGELADLNPLLIRLSTFGLPTVHSLEEGEGILPVPASIRGLAFLSQLAVYKDLVPGYRIRPLSAVEEAEKVRDEVKRLREGEKLLVRSYKGYLKTLEGEVKRRTELASLSMRCMCDLLSSVPHFNLSENIMGILVGRLGRKSWDQDSDLVLQTFIHVFRNDVSAVHTQHLVRLIARMIKERKFQVHPHVLSCLLHLRLRGELDKMRQGKNSKSHGKSRDQMKEKGIFKSEIRKQWQTKNQKKKEKEMKEVQKEMAEAEAEVDKEERSQIQTETLKNLFVLHFSILKHPVHSPLLPSALEGISHFAHLINLDFFRDLLALLRRIVSDQPVNDDTEDQAEATDDPIGAGQIRTRLLAIVTAFDLLSGQGEALNIDLGDFINALFALLRPLAVDTGIEDPPLSSASAPSHSQRPLQAGRDPPKTTVQLLSTTALLFRCLHSIFFSRSASSAASPPWRAAAFAKRLAECSLHFPPATAQQSLEFVRALMIKEPKLEAMLDTEERTFDGVYRPEMDDSQLLNPFATSFWELEVLATQHWDKGTRTEANQLKEGNLVK